VCEVNQAQDAVDHRVADGDERILAAQRNAGQHLSDKKFHLFPSLYRLQGGA
jgi:hypothetical protein